MLEELTDRAILHITGKDSQHFLQRQTTNDLIKKDYSYNFILNNQGRYLFDFFVFKENEQSFYLDIAASSATALINKLNLYKLRREVSIENVSAAFSVIYSNQQLAGSIICLPDPRNKYLLFRGIIAREELAKFLLNTENIYAKNIYLADKYKYAIIDGDKDLIFEKSIPIEYGADSMQAIDYQKGCYVGQEIISRAKYQGVIRKNIYKLILEKEASNLSQGEIVTDLAGNKIGILCSSHKNTAIAQLRTEKYQAMTDKKAILAGIKGKIEIPIWRNETEK